MENAVPVHVLNSLQQLIDVILNSLLRQVVCASFDSFIQVHLHELKDQRQSSSRLVASNYSQATTKTTYYKTSINWIMCGCGLSRCRALISRKF